MSDDRRDSPSSHDGPAPEIPAPEIPDVELIRPIGEGGFGQVWLASNQTTGQLRAVKLIRLRHPQSQDPAGREITSITRLEESLRNQHPNLLTIHHVGKTADYLFYIMDLADDASGGPATAQPSYVPATLQDRLDGGPISPADCLRLARQLLAGLTSLHEAGMVHRDVKPSNCLFVVGELKLADFGLLTEANPQVSQVGTQKYMPPDGRMGTRADVYAAGLVIYEMVTGMPADSFPHLGGRGPEIADDPTLRMLNQLVLRACDPDPEERFADARAMAAELLALETTTAKPRGAGRKVLLTMVCLMLLASGATAVAFWPRGTVTVNFITEPYEATIFVDGKQLMQSEGTPYKTPCTVENLPQGTHRVVFKHLQRGEAVIEAIEFAKTPEIIAPFDVAR